MYPPAQAHTSMVASDRIDFCRADATRINLPRGAHTALSVATTVAPGNSGCCSSHTEGSEKSRGLPDDDSVSLLASDTEFDAPQPKDPSTVASSLQEINKLYCSEERVGAPLCDFMADTINVMGRQHMEVSPLETLMARQIRPANVDLQLKQVNEEIYSRQGGGMSNARGKDGSLKKVNNILIKSMMPLMRVVDKLYLADTTEAEAPSMKAVFDSCMTSLSLLNEANLEVETLCRDAAFKPTTPRIYKSLISKPGVSKTLLFGDNMEDQMKSLETKEKLQKALEPEKPQTNLGCGWGLLT